MINWETHELLQMDSEGQPYTEEWADDLKEPSGTLSMAHSTATTAKSQNKEDFANQGMNLGH
jgi:cyclophilin family peptidyl-prolyl cis-trans isomerase